MPILLVTGSEGFIGRPLVKYLRQTGYEVFTLDLHGAGDKHFNIDIVDGDLELLLNYCFDEIYKICKNFQI
jgi:nucleoside-diphosphate-sugar epimerase